MARTACSLTFCNKPMAIQVAIIDVPPADTNGSGMPVIGMMPSDIPMFSNIWKASHATMPVARPSAARFDASGRI